MQQRDKELTKKQVENVSSARPKPKQVYRPKENVVSLSNAFNTMNRDLNDANQIAEPSSKGHNEITHVFTGLDPIVEKDDDVNASNVDIITEFNKGTKKDEQVDVVQAEVAKDMEKDDVLYEGENQVQENQNPLNQALNVDSDEDSKMEERDHLEKEIAINKEGKKGIGGCSSISLRDEESTSEASFQIEDFSPSKIYSKSSGDDWQEVSRKKKKVVSIVPISRPVTRASKPLLK